MYEVFNSIPYIGVAVCEGARSAEKQSAFNEDTEAGEGKEEAESQKVLEIRRSLGPAQPISHIVKQLFSLPQIPISGIYMQTKPS